MSYIKVNEGGGTEYPYNLAKLRKDFPNTSFPQPYEAADLSQFGVFPVAFTPPPAGVHGKQRVQELPPIQINGVWTQQWDVRATTPSEETEVVAEIRTSFFAAMMLHADNTARARGYFDATHCLTRGGSFTADANKFRAWTDACLTTLKDTFTAYAGGTPLPPAPPAFLASLPAMVW